IFGEHLQLAGRLGLLGALAIAIGALFVALAYVIVAKSGRDIPALSVTTGQMVAGAVPLLLAGAFLEGNPLHFHWTRNAILALLYLALAGSVAGFWLNYWLLRRVGPTPVLAVSIVEPLFAVLLGALFLQEVLTWRVAAGGACVLVSAAMILLPRSGERDAPHSAAEDGGVP
ncbi:MAG: DMT family transporter, partial [Thermoanaerobaculia bacterium]